MALPDAMVEMIPDTLPASSTAGERRVFATLARLPDDCLIYYEPVMRRRYPDLIAILPMESQRYVAGSRARMLQVGTLATAARNTGPIAGEGHLKRPRPSG
jgi:hypothetical protein